ncbi:MAG: hypothetical protein ABSA66_00400 [Roseiarcus sp.]|jgi:hypothetical protein
MKRILLCLAALLALGAGAHAGGIVVPAEQRYSAYSAELPPCDDPGVLARITDRFAQRESGYWNSPLQIAGYDRIREIGFRSNGLGYIPRRYCVARALDADSRPRTVIYDVEESLGVIGWGYGVEWCVVGLDRNLAYAPACSALRPFVEGVLSDKALRALY